MIGTPHDPEQHFKAAKVNKSTFKLFESQENLIALGTTGSRAIGRLTCRRGDGIKKMYYLIHSCTNTFSLNSNYFNNDSLLTVVIDPWSV
jgi:hypothetical protein